MVREGAEGFAAEGLGPERGQGAVTAFGGNGSPPPPNVVTREHLEYRMSLGMRIFLFGCSGDTVVHRGLRSSRGQSRQRGCSDGGCLAVHGGPGCPMKTGR